MYVSRIHTCTHAHTQAHARGGLCSQLFLYYAEHLARSPIIRYTMQLNIVLTIADLFIDTSGSEDWDNGRTFACRILSISSSFTFCLQWQHGTTATTTVINSCTIPGYCFLHHTHTLTHTNTHTHTHTPTHARTHTHTRARALSLAHTH